MNKILKKYIFLILILVPTLVLAGGNTDDNVDSDYELAIPSYNVSYVNDYIEYYTCKYRMRLSEESNIWQGSFDVTMNISKKGGVQNIIVNQSSKISDWTDIDIGKLEAVNALPENKIYYNSTTGYFCPEIMAYISEKPLNESNGSSLAKGVFKIEEYNNQKYNSNPKNQSIDIYYKLHNYNKSLYNCQVSSETECNNKQYCNWVLVDSGHRNYSCLEVKFGTTNSNSETTETPTGTPSVEYRTESCTGYTESIFNQTVEYSFSADGTINANHGNGDFGMRGSSNLVDKNGKLWELWKKGQCCSNGMFAVTYNSDSTVFSCDGSDGGWNFEDNYNYIELPNIPNIDPVTDCKSLLGSPNDKPTGDIPGSPAYYISFVLKIMRYVAIVILIALSVIDYSKAVYSKDSDAITKSMSSAIKRLIICVIIFFIPTLIEVILKYVHTVATDTCGIN